MKLELPIVVSGRFSEARDEDWYSFSAQKGRRYTIFCRPLPAGRETLPIVSIVDKQGAVLHETKSVESTDRRCVVEWNAPSDGEYSLHVRDLQYGIRGGSQFIYQLTVREARPDFALRLKSDFLSVIQGEQRAVEVEVVRRGGFDGDIEIEAAGLPAGVTAEAVTVPKDKNTVTVNVKAAAEARPTDTTVRLTGKATVGARVLEHFARAPHWGIDAEGVSVAPPELDHVHLTVRHKPVFRLYCEEAYKYANRGTVYPYAMEIERLNGFDGDIVLQIGDRQNRDLDGIVMFETTLGPTVTSGHMPIYLPETMHINIQSQSQLYVQAYALFQDRWDQEQSVLVVSEKRCMIRTMPTVTKLNARTETVAVRPDTTSLYCELHLQRTSNFNGTLAVELLDPPPGFAAETTQLPEGASSAVVRVEVRGPRPSADEVRLRFRGTGTMENGRTVITESVIPVEFVGFAASVASAQ